MQIARSLFLFCFYNADVNHKHQDSTFIKLPVFSIQGLFSRSGCSSHIHLEAFTGCSYYLKEEQLKRFIHNIRSTKRKAFLFFHSELEVLMAKACQRCLRSRSRAPRLWQPLPFWKQSSQITWPQLVKRNLGVALRGSQKQALQKTRTAMQQRGRRGWSGAGG